MVDKPPSCRPPHCHSRRSLSPRLLHQRVLGSLATFHVRSTPVNPPPLLVPLFPDTHCAIPCTPPPHTHTQHAPDDAVAPSPSLRAVNDEPAVGAACRGGDATERGFEVRAEQHAFGQPGRACDARIGQVAFDPGWIAVGDEVVGWGNGASGCTGVDVRATGRKSKGGGIGGHNPSPGQPCARASRRRSAMPPADPATQTRPFEPRNHPNPFPLGLTRTRCAGRRRRSATPRPAARR